MKIYKIAKRIIIICICFGAVGLLALLTINGHIKHAVEDRIVEADSLPDEDMDCILVLGCQETRILLLQSQNRNRHI